MEPKMTAREKLLAAADELFYAEGIHTVGIDRVIKQAGVAKASLYACFANKEDLVRAHLELRLEKRRRRVEGHVARATTPRAKILAVYDALQETVSDPKFRGCAFTRATGEGTNEDTQVTAVCDASRKFTVDTFVDLAKAYGAKDPTELGKRLLLLYDGALASALEDKHVVKRAKAMAELLLGA